MADMNRPKNGKSCPVCLSGNKKTSLIEHDKEYAMYHCRDCDAIFSDPMKNPGSGWYQESEMYVLARTFEYYTSVRWNHKQFLKPGKIYGETLLDAGCGAGGFLKEAQSAGYKVYGVDFDGESVKVAKEKLGLDTVYQTTLEEFVQSRAETFDVITFFEVIEHVDDPNGFIIQVKKLLNEGGYIALSTRNRNRFLDWEKQYDRPPHHLTRWNTNAVRSLLERHGFEIVRLFVKHIDIEDISGYLKSKLAFGIGRKLERNCLEKKDKGSKQKAKLFNVIKDIIFKSMSVPVLVILGLFNLQGADMYCLARLKNDKDKI